MATHFQPARMMAVVIAPGLLLLPIGTAKAQRSADVARPAIQLPGPSPQYLKNLNCEKLEALEGSVMTINGTIIGKAEVYAIELIGFQSQYSDIHCDNQIKSNSYCAQISSHLEEVESKIKQTNTDIQKLNDYYKAIGAAAKAKDCSFERWENEH